MPSTEAPAYVTRFRDLRTEFWSAVVFSVASAVMVVVVGLLDDHDTSGWVIAGSALLVPGYFGWLFAGDYAGRWVALDRKTFDFDTTSVLPVPFFARRNAHSRIRLHTGGKNARMAYRRFLRDVDPLGKKILTTEEALAVITRLPPSGEVLELVKKHRVTDVEAIEGVLAGSVPLEWARAYSSGMTEDAA